MVIFLLVTFKPRRANAADPDMVNHLANMNISPSREKKEPSVAGIQKGEAYRRRQKEDRIQRRQVNDAERNQRALIKSTRRLTRQTQLSLSERWLARSYPKSIQLSLAEAKKMLPGFSCVDPSWITPDEMSPEQLYESATIVAGWMLPGGGGTMPPGRRMPQSLVDSINMDLDSRAYILRSTRAIDHRSCG